MTPAQLLILKNDILITNSASLQAYVDAIDDQAIADWYNTVATPDHWVYVSRLSKEMILRGTSQDGTTFTFAGVGFIGRSVQELLVWREMFDLNGNVDPSKERNRQGFIDIFSGTGNAASNRAHIAALARRKALRIEQLFAVGAGTTGSPATMVLEGDLNYIDVARALRNVGV